MCSILVSMKNRLSPLTVDKIAYYVYALIDPRTKKVFYVGKGKGNRIYAHVEASEAVDTKEVDKIATIRAIRSAGKQVGHVVIRHGLSESEAFAVEASLINYIESVQKIALTNLMSGHYTAESGIRTIEDIEIQYEAKPAVITHPMVLIRINQAYKPGMTKSALYEVTRKHWKMSPRVKSYRYACAVYLGIVRDVYEVSRWYESTEVPGRWEFEGKKALPEIHERYLHTSVAHLMSQGSQNPFRYIDVDTEINEKASRAFMDGLTASDEMHRKAMRGITPEIATELLKRCYNLTDAQATKAQHLRDVVGMSEDDAIVQVTKSNR